MKNLIARFVKDDQGQDLIEYALLAGFISLAVVSVVVLIGDNLDRVYGLIDAQLTNIQ